MIASSLDQLFHGLAPGLVVCLVAGFYVLLFFRWMRSESSDAISSIPLQHIIIMGVLAALNLYVLIMESLDPSVAGPPSAGFWFVGVLPPLVLFTYGLTTRRAAALRKRVIYHTMCFTWIAFGNLPWIGEMI